LTYSGPLAEAFPEHLQHPVLVRELAGLRLGVNELAVDRQLEHAPAGRNQRPLLDVLLELGQNLARQTDGLGFVVSHRTVDEFDFHGSFLLLFQTYIIEEGRRGRLERVQSPATFPGINLILWLIFPGFK
jgi:hypothetical protein